MGNTCKSGKEDYESLDEVKKNNIKKVISNHMFDLIDQESK